MVRPKKYENEIMCQTIINAPGSWREYIDEICNIKDMCLCDFIITATYNQDPDKAAMIIKELRELKKQIKIYEKKLSESKDDEGFQVIDVPGLTEFLDGFGRTRTKSLEKGVIDSKTVYEIFLSKLAGQGRTLNPQQAQMAKLKIKDWIYPKRK